MLVDQPLNEIGDVLLPGSGRIQFPSHLGEAPINMIPKIKEVLAQVDEVLPHDVESCGRRLAKVADLGSDLSDVAVRRAG